MRNEEKYKVTKKFSISNTKNEKRKKKEKFQNKRTQKRN
jgi:hypothetical protein